MPSPEDRFEALVFTVKIIFAKQIHNLKNVQGISDTLCRPRPVISSFTLHSHPLTTTSFVSRSYKGLQLPGALLSPG